MSINTNEPRPIGCDTTVVTQGATLPRNELAPPPTDLSSIIRSFLLIKTHSFRNLTNKFTHTFQQLNSLTSNMTDTAIPTNDPLNIFAAPVAAPTAEEHSESSHVSSNPFDPLGGSQSTSSSSSESTQEAAH